MTPPAEAPYAVDPFGPSANPAAYIPNAAMERARAELEERLGRNRSAALVGPPGHGKTLLLHLIGASQKERSRVAYVPFASLGVEELFRVVLENLGSPLDMPPTEALPTLVAELGPRGGVTLLIDDAHSMQTDTAEVLAQILRMARGDLRLVLAALDGDATFRLLQSFGDHLGVVRLDEGLSADEARRYIELRLAYSGASPELVALFDDERVAELYHESQGVPRELNRAAQEVVRGLATRDAPRLADLSSKPPPEEEEAEVSLSSLAERVLDRVAAGGEGDDPFSRLAEREGHADAPAAETEPAAPAAADTEPEVPAAAAAEARPAAAAPATPEAESTVTAPAAAAPVSAPSPPEPEPAAPEPVRAAPAAFAPHRAARERAAAAPGPERDRPAAAPERPAPARTGPDSRVPALPPEPPLETILEPNPPPPDPANVYGSREAPAAAGPAPGSPESGPQRSRPSVADERVGAYRMARDPGAAARRATGGSEFASRSGPPRRDPAPAPGFEEFGPRSELVWNRKTFTWILRWTAFGAGLGAAFMWATSRDEPATIVPVPAPAPAAERVEAPPETPAIGTTPALPELPATEGEWAAELPAEPEPPVGDPFAVPSELTPEVAPGPTAAPAPAPAPTAERRPTRPPPAAPSQPAPAPPPVQMISVSINATPWAHIEVDGRPLGETPLARVPLEAGPHRFRATFPDGRVRVETIEIGPDQRAISFR